MQWFEVTMKHTLFATIISYCSRTDVVAFSVVAKA